jgi:hypothetical protein
LLLAALGEHSQLAESDFDLGCERAVKVIDGCQKGLIQ